MSTTILSVNTYDDRFTEALNKIEKDLKKHRRNMNRSRWRNTRLKRKH